MDELPKPGERYFLEECLGTGAFGKVFCATDTQNNNKTIAIKIQKLNEKCKSYIDQEHKVLQKLSWHVNLPDFYGTYRKGDEVWFAIEICSGGSVIELVQTLLAQNRRLREEHIAYILKETVKAVTFLHENFCIHRDIKAKNILLTKEGEVKLVDFGLSCFLKSLTDQSSECTGSPAWMAPEIITCRRSGTMYGNRADVWSLGITAIELGDGVAPNQLMHPTRTLFQIVSNPPPTLYRKFNWSEDYSDFISECLVKNPEHRPYITELIEHPFLKQIPENNYYLTLEIKSLIEDVSKLNPRRTESEVVLIEDFIKCDASDNFEKILHEDVASLDVISDDQIVSLLENRLKLGQFQTFIGDILLILNPNEEKQIYDTEYHSKYQLKCRSDNPPHIYAIADSAYQNALHHCTPQKIILSGESGSGKSVNYHYLISHLLYLGQNTNINLERIKDAVQLIQSMTHASTPINRCSTRCILITTLTYGSTGKVSGAIFNVCQLEKWRISSCDGAQGNFHFLHYIYAGLVEMKKTEANYLYKYLRTTNDKVDDKYDFIEFEKILKIFQAFDFCSEEIDTVFSVVAAILNLGEVSFENNETENKNYVEKSAQLLKIDPNKLQWAFANQCVVRNGSVIKRKYTTDEAKFGRDVFVNNLYARIVDYIVAHINNKLLTGLKIFGEKYSIQIYDYFGFECFKTNDLSQLFVNCFNEQLQYYYTQKIFAWEYLDMEDDGLEFESFPYFDNKMILDELLNKSEGIFSIIDEASKMNHNDKYVIGFIENSENMFIQVVGRSEFSVSHYTGKVTYNAKKLCEKNKDFVSVEIIETLRSSDNPIIKVLFTNKLDKFGNLIFPPVDEKNKYKSFSKKEISIQFSQSKIKQMTTCIRKYKATSLELFKDLSLDGASGGTHFVRCIRTNLNGKPGHFDKELVKQQVKALALTETANLRQKGYSHRIPFNEFLRRYKFLAFDFNENVDISKNNCRLLLIRLGMEGWNVGKSKVFLRYYNEEYLARLYENQVKKIIKIQSILRRFLTKCFVSKQLENKNKKLSDNGKLKTYRMTEEEAAAIIQRAYRDSTIKKSYHDFAKDYNVLDEETCMFIKKFAYKWRKNSLYHVLLLYKSLRYQDCFNFSQQVHFYGISVFYELQKVNCTISLDIIEEKAVSSSWMKQLPIPVRKIPFRLQEIPFCDSSSITSNSLLNNGISDEKNDSWDIPYRRQALSNFKEKSNLISCAHHAEDMNKFIDENHSHVEDEQTYEKALNKVNESNQKLNTEVQLKDEIKINSNTKSANKDFDYIKCPLIKQTKSLDPVAELRQIGQKNVSENEPPFNFQGMLRKTNFQKSVTQEKETIPLYSLRKTQQRDQIKNEVNDKNTASNVKTNFKEKCQNGTNTKVITEKMICHDKRVIVQLAPGIIIEGYEINI